MATRLITEREREEKKAIVRHIYACLVLVVLRGTTSLVIMPRADKQWKNNPFAYYTYVGGSYFSCATTILALVTMYVPLSNTPISHVKVLFRTATVMLITSFIGAVDLLADPDIKGHAFLLALACPLLDYIISII